MAGPSVQMVAADPTVGQEFNTLLNLACGNTKFEVKAEEMVSACGRRTWMATIRAPMA